MSLREGALFGLLFFGVVCSGRGGQDDRGSWIVNRPRTIYRFTNISQVIIVCQLMLFWMALESLVIEAGWKK